VQRRLSAARKLVADRHRRRGRSRSSPRRGVDVGGDRARADGPVVEPHRGRDGSRRPAFRRRRRGGRRGGAKQVRAASYHHDGRRSPRTTPRPVLSVGDSVGAGASRRIVGGIGSKTVALQLVSGGVVHARVAQRHRERLAVFPRQNVVEDRVDRRTDEVQNACITEHIACIYILIVADFM